MQRKALIDIEKWYKNEFRKPLLIYGARQVGKTTLIKDIFAPKYFDNKHVLYIDFRYDSDERKYIKNNIDVDKIINYLSLKHQITINENTLLIFDEVQECIQLLTCLKYFCQKYRNIPVIVTGSLVRTKLKQMEVSSKIELDSEILKENQDGHNNYMFPVGKIDEYDLYPFTFDEYFEARNAKLYQHIKDSFEKNIDLEREYHNLALNIFNEYMLIGGLPENIDIFLKTNSYEQARRNLISIYDNYLNDMVLYQISDSTILRTRRLFDNIYEQLNKENKNVKITDIEKNKRFRDYIYPLDWLNLSRLVYESHQLKEFVSLPLKKDKGSLFRLYLPDVGLFAYQSGISPESFIDDTKVSSLSGIFYENYVALELYARGFKLFYWKGKTSSEMEFVIPYKTNVIPIDVKKNKGNLNSLTKFREHNKNSFAIKISNNMYGYNKDNNLYTVPFYYVGLFFDKLKKEEL